MSKDMSNFDYKGLTFHPFKTLKGKASDFFAISKRISDVGLTPQGWHWNEFHEIAKENGAEYIDLFQMNGKIVIPGENYLFEYR